MSYLRRVLPYLRPYRRLAALSVLIMFATAAVGLLLPWPMKVVVDNVVGDHPLPGWMHVVLGPFASRQMLLLGIVVVSGFLLVLLQNGLTLAENYVDTRLDLGMVLDFRSDLFRHVQRLPMAYHDQQRAGTLIYSTNFQGAAASRF